MPKPDVSFFFPVYNDEKTIRIVAENALKALDRIANKYEVIIVNDASPDNSGNIANELSECYDPIRVIHHKNNLGYGAAVKTGIKNCRYSWICMVDGDNEYDIYDLEKMLSLRHYYMLIIAFRYKKIYSAKRIFISKVYNTVLRLMFRSRFKDISTGIRVFNKKLFDDIELKSNSPFIGAELAIKAMLRGYPIGEVGIQTFPRKFGQGGVVTFENIIKTIKDMFLMYKEVFSDTYQLPKGRSRKGGTN